MAPIPSPFNLGREDAFLAEISFICNKYGYASHLIFAGQPESERESEWTGRVIPFYNEGMLDALDEFTAQLREKIENK